jgi:hypothetical protein
LPGPLHLAQDRHPLRFQNIVVRIKHGAYDISQINGG